MLHVGVKLIHHSGSRLWDEVKQTNKPTNQPTKRKMTYKKKEKDQRESGAPCAQPARSSSAVLSVAPSSLMAADLPVHLPVICNWFVTHFTHFTHSPTDLLDSWKISLPLFSICVYNCENFHFNPNFNPHRPKREEKSSVIALSPFPWLDSSDPCYTSVCYSGFLSSVNSTQPIHRVQTLP